MLPYSFIKKINFLNNVLLIDYGNDRTTFNINSKSREQR